VEVADEIFGDVFTQITYHKTHLLRENIEDEDSLSDRETLNLSYGAPRQASRARPTLVVERLKAALPKEITIEKP
jgi:hypothetical protein